MKTLLLALAKQHDAGLTCEVLKNGAAGCKMSYSQRLSERETAAQ